MATAPASRQQLPTTLAATLAVAKLAATAHASTLTKTDCSGPGGALACRLTGVLHILYILAAFFGFVLLVVIAVAFHIYRKNIAEDQQRRP